MKFLKTITLPAMVFTSCFLGLGTSLVNAPEKANETVEVKADFISHVDYNYLAMNESNFKVVEGADKGMAINVTKKGSYWFENEKAPYGAIDDFLGPQANESTTGAIQSSTWTSEANTYITFTLGGGPRGNTVELYKTTNNGETSELKHTFNTTDMGNVTYLMMPRMYKIEEAGDYYLKLIDNSTDNYGNIIFGGLCVNQSAEDAKQMIELWKLGRRWANLNENWFENISYDLDGVNYTPGYTKIFEQLANNDEFKDARDAQITSTSFNEDFEESTWLLNWTLDYTYANKHTKTDYDSTLPTDLCIGYNWSNARSDATTHEKNNMPYNQTNSQYFHGYYDENDKGFIAGNQYKYRIISKAFKLSSDLISVKLSGYGAQLQLLSAEQDDNNNFTVLGTIENDSFKDGDTSNIAKSGTNCITMRRYIANVSDYNGKLVRLGMVDSSTDSWGAINVDEIVTNIDANTFSFKVDTFTQTNDTGTSYGQLTDKYVVLSDKEGKHQDINDAYDYLQEHYTTLRSADHGANFCDIKTSTEVTSLLDKFNNLSDGAAAIVNRSQDYNHGASATSENWYSSEAQVFEAWKTIDYLMKENGKTNSHPYTSSMNNVVSKISNNTTFMVTSIIIAIFAVISIGGFVIFKNKKNEEKD